MNLKRAKERSAVRGEKNGVSSVFKTDEMICFVCSTLKYQVSLFCVDSG